MNLQDSRSDERVAYALLRAVAGMNLLMHGASRLLAGANAFAAHMGEQFSRSPLPPKLVHVFGVTLPFVEATIGLLLLIGWRTRAALMAALLLMMVLTFGSSLLQEWSAASIQLTYAFVFAALLGLRRFNAWCLDRSTE